MPKQPNEFLTNLQLASDYLQQARQQLIRCDSLPGQTEPTLLRVAALLQGLADNPARSQMNLSKDPQAVVDLLLTMRACSARTQMLLDTAASFHCGAALAGPPIPETYTPDGGWQTIYPNDQICLNA